MRRGTQLLSPSLSAAVMAHAPSQERRTTSRAPVGLAPDPAATPEAVVQVYGSRCSGWLGYFGVHTWIAVKPAGARAYTTYEVLDWRLRRSGSAVVIRKRAPDARWAGNAPAILANKRGDGVDALIERIDKAAREYPFAGQYTAWPGPNSNTFTAYVARAVPELGLDLPPADARLHGNRWRRRPPSVPSRSEPGKRRHAFFPAHAWLSITGVYNHPPSS